MAKWRSRAHQGVDADFFGNREQQSRRRRNRLAERNLRIEPCEERKLFAVAPQLIAVIPNEGSVIDQGEIVTIAPRELTLRFDEGQVIDASTITSKSISIVRDGDDNNINVNNLPVNIGFRGVGEFPNEIVIRFAENLPDDEYRVQITAGLKNTAGDSAKQAIVTTACEYSTCSRLTGWASSISSVPRLSSPLTASEPRAIAKIEMPNTTIGSS